MAGALAEALAEIENPETIIKVLESSNVDGQLLNDISTEQDQPSLSGLYDRYLNRRRNRSPTTRSQYKRTIPDFVVFAEDRRVQKPAELSPELVDTYVDKLFAEYDSDATILTYTKNIRAWLSWLEKRNLCDDDVYSILDKDELGLSPNARDEALPKAIATAVLEKLRQRRFGKPMHTLFELVWNGGPRLGGIQSLDVCDFDSANNSISFRHRPETGTRLKNGNEEDNRDGDGERDIEISDDVVNAIQQYIAIHRPDVTDDYGREPLFTTTHGRASRSTLRRWLYKTTSCRWIPQEEDVPECDGICSPDSNVCPQSYYPHAIRRGAIVRHLSGELDPHYASERFDVAQTTIDKHYDPRSKRREKEDRAQAVRDAW